MRRRDQRTAAYAAGWRAGRRAADLNHERELKTTLAWLDHQLASGLAEIAATNQAIEEARALALAFDQRAAGATLH